MYEALTNQQINHNKFEIFFPRLTKSSTRQEIYSFFHVKEGKFPFKYLGTMISPKRIPISDFDSMAQHIHGKLGNWNVSNLSQAGRVTD